MLQLLLDLVAPPTCGACGAFVIDRDAALCAACALTCDPAPPTPPVLSAPRFATGAHHAALRDAVLAFKTAPRPDLARPLARRIVQTLPDPMRVAVRTVVPVPDHPARTIERGFDPVARLAVHVAGAIGARVELRALRWRALRDKQAHLDVAARATATTALCAARSVTGPVLVLDDVSTTGATLEGAVRALRAAGVAEVVTACVSATARHDVMAGATAPARPVHGETES